MRKMLLLNRKELRIDHTPFQLLGGIQISRALVSNSRTVMFKEPSGAKEGKPYSTFP